MVLPAVAMLLGLLGAAVCHGVAMVKAQEAASAVARIAIVDTDSNASDVALAIVGADARIDILRDGEWIRVTVADRGPWGLEARATAVTRVQD